jgi:peroxiredoxin Q/BCP
MTRHPTTRVAIALAATFLAASAGQAQQAPAAPAPSYPAPEVGSMAPDFTLPGATRYGLLRDPVHLSDYRGKTVVLAFFYRARTKG